MEYIGLQTQVRRNNTRSLLMLLSFPFVIALLVWLFFFITLGIGFSSQDKGFFHPQNFKLSTEVFLPIIPWVLAACMLWFVIAYFINAHMIKVSTGSYTLSRVENKRIYNLVENLCMSQGMPMPKINVIDDSSLNAFASGISKNTYTVTLTRGIIDTLDDSELEGVIAHELTHIQNRDVRVLIISIVFVGIFTFLSELLLRGLFSGRGGKKNNIVMILVALALVAIGYLVSMLMRFSISRKREYMADAGAVQMTKHPMALASALRKISANPKVESVTNADVAQLFIENALHKKSFLGNLFSSHPPIEKRIQILEQF